MHIPIAPEVPNLGMLPNTQLLKKKKKKTQSYSQQGHLGTSVS